MSQRDDLHIQLEARPEPLILAPSRTAVIVVDLQNGYASKGGYRDLRGRDISGTETVVENTNRILKEARAAGCTVVLLQNGWEPGLADAGRPHLAQLAQKVSTRCASCAKGRNCATRF